jgi:N-ethylmaleimide reductase
MTEPTLQPLLTPVRMGDLLLPNRIVMAPLTRMRATNPGHVPAELQARYYAQRASAGIIIGECAAISPQGYKSVCIFPGDFWFDLRGNDPTSD